MQRPVFALILVSLTLTASAQERHNFGPDDALALKSVRDPQLSPDGRWIAYAVGSLDLKEDTGDTNLHMVSFDGAESVQLTYGKKSESRPRWSPDGRYLGFLSSREGDKSQVWLLDRRGGEAFQLTELKGGVSDFVWSPDGSRLAVVSHDPDPKDEDGDKEKKKTEPPIVVTRLQFKQDGEGYLDDRRDHLYVVALSDRKAVQITTGPYDDGDPAWSPDGKRLAFVSNRTENPDSNHNSDVFVVAAEGGEAVRLTTNPGPDGSPVWSPDGRWIACVSSLKPELMWYAVDQLRLIPVDGGEPRNLTAALDRNPRNPQFDGDGGHVYFLLEDSGLQHLARVPAEGGEIERVIAGDREVEDYSIGAEGRAAALISEPGLPGEIHAFAPDAPLVQVSRHNQAVLDQVRLGQFENIHFASSDGTEIEGFVVKPPDFEAGRRHPTVLWIHGGPVAQFSVGFNPAWQVFAGAGYVVVAANPRGSSGYGEAFSKAIFADWGNKDFEDVMAAVDHVVKLGYADESKLGVGGWSYGGILTNYVITKTDRFAAAISGASETDYQSCYGTDHYQRDWEAELGLPWKNRELYAKLSPLTHVENIVTPTLILCGEKDWNVPLNQSEQLYQRLRRRGLDTQLIVYPGQSHGIRTPSYQKDRYQRFLEWYDRLLMGKTKTVEPSEAPSPGRD